MVYVINSSLTSKLNEFMTENVLLIITNKLVYVIQRNFIKEHVRLHNFWYIFLIIYQTLPSGASSILFSAFPIFHFCCCL